MLNFDVRSVAPISANEPVPNGKYKVIVTKTNIGSTRDGQNGAVKVNATIIDGPYKDRPLWKQFNIYHTDKTTSFMAYGELSAIGWAMGVFQLQEQPSPDNMLPMLHNRPHIWVVTVEADKVSSKLRNQVSGFEDINGVDATKLAAGAVSQQAPGGPPGGPPQGFGQPAGAPPSQQGYGAPQGAPPQAQPQWAGGPTEPQQHTPPQWGAPTPQGAPPPNPGGYAPQPQPQPGAAPQWGAPQPQPTAQPQYAPQPGAPAPQPQNWGPQPGAAPQPQPGAWAPQPQANGAPPPVPWGGQR